MYRKFEQLASEIETFTQGMIMAEVLQERFESILSEYIS